MLGELDFNIQVLNSVTVRSAVFIPNIPSRPMAFSVLMHATADEGASIATDTMILTFLFSFYACKIHFQMSYYGF